MSWKKCENQQDNHLVYVFDKKNFCKQKVELKFGDERVR